MPDSPHTADIVELVARLTALTNELDTHGDKDDASAVRAAIAALEVADTRQDRGSNSGGRKASPNSKATKAMRDTPTEAMIEAGCRAWMKAGGHHCDSEDLVGPIYTAMQAARSETPEATEMCDACNGSGFGVADTYCGKCGGAGGYPVRSETPVQDDDAEWLRGLAAYPFPFIQETRDRIRRIADRLRRLSPTPDTGLIEALRQCARLARMEPETNQLANAIIETVVKALANAAPAQVESGMPFANTERPPKDMETTVFPPSARPNQATKGDGQ